jgi:hypothetical protein
MYKNVKMYSTHIKNSKNTYIQTHTHCKKHTHIHIIQCPEQYLNQDSPKHRTGLIIVNVFGVQEGKQGEGRG